MALAGTVEDFIYLEEGDMVELSLDGARVVERQPRNLAKSVTVE
jgi:glucosamine--fructose-6-phosphate aminotransferase (isomerizing)